MWLDSVEQRPPLYNLQHFQKSEGEGGGVDARDKKNNKKTGRGWKNRDRTSVDETKTKIWLVL